MTSVWTPHIISALALTILSVIAVLFGTMKIPVNDAEAIVEDAIGNGQQNIVACDSKVSNLAYKLDGNATDPDGGPIASFSWTILAVPEGGVANIEEDDSGSTTPQASLFINNGCGTQGSYIVELATQDDDSQTGSDIITIDVNQPILNTTANATINPVANLTTNQTLTTNSTSGNATSANVTTPLPINGNGILPGVIINGTDGNNGNVTVGVVESHITNITTLRTDNNLSKVEPEDPLESGIMNGTESSRTQLSPPTAAHSAPTIDSIGSINNNSNAIINTLGLSNGNIPRVESLVQSISPILASTAGNENLVATYHPTLVGIKASEVSDLRIDGLDLQSPSSIEHAYLVSHHNVGVSASSRDFDKAQELVTGAEITSAVTSIGNVDPTNFEEDDGTDDISVEDNLLRISEDEDSSASGPIHLNLG